MKRLQIDLPNRKVTVAGAVGAGMTLLFTVLGRFGVEVSAEEAVGVATLVAFLLSYYVPEPT